MDGEHRFRGAAFGFNRQDVVRYIEEVHRDYAGKLAQLEKSLEEERQARLSVEERQSLAGQEAAAAGEDAHRARTDLQAANETLAALRRERDELFLQLKVTRQELADLQTAADRMAPAARAYEALKDKAAGIELEARSRAEAIVRDGRRQADAARRDVLAWMSRVESSYARLQADVAATVTHAVGEMERTGQSLDEVNEELAGHRAHLGDIARAVEADPDAPQAPEHTA